MSELLHCPFCGSANTDESMVRGYADDDTSQPIIAAGCYDCGATGPEVKVPDHSTGYSEASAAWSTRQSVQQEKVHHWLWQHNSGHYGHCIYNSKEDAEGDWKKMSHGGEAVPFYSAAPDKP